VDGWIKITRLAETDCSVMLIRAEVPRALMYDRSDVLDSVMALVDGNMRPMVVQIEQLKTRSAAQRLAQFVVELCPVDRGPCRVRLPFEKAVIAGQLGMKPESLSRAFVRLALLGLRVDGSMTTVPDVDPMRPYAQSDRADAWTKAG